MSALLDIVNRESKRLVWNALALLHGPLALVGSPFDTAEEALWRERREAQAYNASKRKPPPEYCCLCEAYVPPDKVNQYHERRYALEETYY